jgi:hypothetical protein
MTVTLNFSPEVEAGLSARAQAAGSTIEEYLQRLVQNALPDKTNEFGRVEGSGMVWEDGLLIYGAGTSLPEGVVDNAVRRSREERSQHISDNHP